jgi:hypothetical protein
LRAREGDVRELREELDRCHVYNQALQTELKTIRGEAPVLDAEHPVPIYPVRSVVLGRQTGGHDGENGIGDDALQVIIEPHDAENQSVKVPGAVHVDVLEVTPAGLKQPLSSWDIPPEELSRSWRIGLLSTGYKLVLPWKVWPSTEKLRVIVTMRLADGRVFEADKDVTIRLPTDKRRPMEKAEPSEPLPQPRRVPPMTKPDSVTTPVPPVTKPAPTPSLLPAPTPLPPAPVPVPVPTGPELPEPTASLGTPKAQIIPVKIERPKATEASRERQRSE